MKHNLTNPTQTNTSFIGRMICILLLVFFVHNQNGFGQLLTEPFNYSINNDLTLQSGGVWVTINSGDTINVSSGNLSYGPLVASSGNSVSYGGAGKDYYTTFTSQTSGTVYYSFLLNIATLGTLNITTGGYTIGLIDGTINSFVARCFLRASGANYNIGINAGSTAGNLAWATNTLTVGTTYLVVVSHQLVAGASNDVSKVWINPAIGGAEPAFNATSTNLTGGDLASIQRIFLRQDNTTNTPSALTIDEIRVGTTWSSVTPVPATTLADIVTQPFTPIITGNPNVVLAGFTVAATSASNFTAVTITGGGSATSSDINTVRVFRDNDGNGAINGADASVSGAGVAFAASMPLTITGETGITTARNYLIVANVDAAADVSRNVSVSVGPGNYSASITPNNGSASGALREIDGAPTPTINLSAAALTSFSTVAGTPSASQSYTVDGSALSNNLVITAPANFQVDAGSGFGSSATLFPSPAPPGPGAVTTTTINVRYNPSVDGSSSGNITHVSSPAVQQVKAVSGNTISTVSFGAITTSSMVINFPGGGGANRIVVLKNASAVSYVPTDFIPLDAVNSNYFLAHDTISGNRIVYEGSGNTVTVTGLSHSVQYHVAVYEYNGASGATADYFTASAPARNNATTLARVIVPVPMGGLTFTENFNDEANWGNDFNFGIGAEHWGSVDVNVTGTIPDGKRTTVSTATFITVSTTGGLQRGSLSGFDPFTPFNPVNNVPGTLVFLSSGSTAPSNSCAIDLHLDFTGVSAGTLTFNWAAVISATGDRPTFLRVYTSPDGVTFTELTGAAVLNVANGTPSSGTVSAITLPPSLNGVANARIRFYNYNGIAGQNGTAGSRAKISIDNVTVTAGVPPTKLVVTNINPASPTVNTGFNVTVQAQDALNNPQNVLTNTLVTLSYFSGAGAFTGTLTGTIMAGTNNVVISGVVYNPTDPSVRLTATATSGDPLASGNSAVFSVIDPAPIITVTGTLSPFLAEVLTQSASQSYTVKGDFLTANLVITAPPNFEVRTGLDPFGSSVTLIPSPAPPGPGAVPTTIIDVRYAPLSAGPHSGNVTNASTSATTQNVAVSGTTSAPEPTIVSTVSFSCVNLNSFIVKFIGGNGGKRIVVVSPTPVAYVPTDGFPATGVNRNYSLASPQTPADNRIVFDGSGTTDTISGLSAMTTYYVRVYEYNGSLGTTEYLTTSFGSGSTTTLSPLTYNVAGAPYTQNFNGLPSTGTFILSGLGSFLVSECPIGATNAAGWQFGKDPGVAGGTGPKSLFAVNNGSGTGGSAYSYGATSDPDRALGSLASGTAISSLGLAIVNNTGVALNTVTISYTGEQWRNGGSGNVNTLAFTYSLNGTNIFSGTHIPVTDLNFNSQAVGGAAAALDGNANNLVVTKTFILNDNWLPGATLILKWRDTDDAGSEDGLAIDDFSFSASVPVTPTAQDHDIYFPFVSTNSLKVKWVNEDGANHLVKMNILPGSGFTNPSNFTSYSSNPNWLNLGEQVIYSGPADSVDVTGLAPGTLYEFRVYAFNGSGISARYLTTTEFGNPSAQFTESASAPTKLVFLSVNGGANPVVSKPFSVVIQTQDDANNPQIVNFPTTVNLTPLFGGSIASGTTSGIIAAGSHTVTITGVKYSTPQTSVELNAARSAGVFPLADGQSLDFDVLDTAKELLFNTLPINGIVNTVVGSITVKTVRPDQTIDAGFVGNVTIAFNTGPAGGVVSGTLTQPVIAGVATFSNIQFSLAGPYTLQASSSPTLTSGSSSIIYITNPATMTELVIPKFMGSKSSSGSNSSRTPIAVCLQIDNLVPNTFYNIRTGLDLVGANVGFYGAGNSWSGSAFNTNNILNAFQTDASGSSKPFWVFFQPTGNSSRFGAGQSHNVRIGYVIHGAGNPPAAPNFIGSKAITTLDIGSPTALTTGTSGDDGAFLTGTVASCAVGKYILIYENEFPATGDQPLFSYQARQAIPTDATVANYSLLPALLDSIYVQGVGTVIGEWPAVIPIGANNPNGVRRIEARNADNTIFGAETDDNGIWPGGANTTTIGRRGVATLTPSDAPISILVSSLSPVSACPGNAVVITGSHFTGALAVSFNGTAATFTVINDKQINTTVPNGATTGIVTVTSSTGCIASGPSYTITSCGVSLNANVLLQGYYIGGGLMRPLIYDLDQQEPVPNPLILSDFSDFITISAMEVAAPHNLVDAQVDTLRSNGDVSVTFGPAVVANTSYYIKVDHRNSVETWSKEIGRAHV